jgi:hypothetical protein
MPVQVPSPAVFYVRGFKSDLEIGNRSGCQEYVGGRQRGERWQPSNDAKPTPLTDQLAFSRNRFLRARNQCGSNGKSSLPIAGRPDDYGW